MGIFARKLLIIPEKTGEIREKNVGKRRDISF